MFSVRRSIIQNVVYIIIYRFMYSHTFKYSLLSVVDNFFALGVLKMWGRNLFHNFHIMITVSITQIVQKCADCLNYD